MPAARSSHRRVPPPLLALLALLTWTGTAHAQRPPRDSILADTGRAATADTGRAARSAARDSSIARPAPPPKPKPVWPVKGPAPLPGSILPHRRIVAYYGNPLSRRMGILGEVAPNEMLRRLDREVKAWEAADTTTPVVPALHLIAVVAQGGPGRDSLYRLKMADTLIERVYGWAQRANAIMFLDIQVGKSTLQAELPRLESFLSRADVHLGIDPEFSMKRGGVPGQRIGTYDAADVNYAIRYLADLVERHNLPPKVLVIHRFTQRMLTNADKIKLDPRVQVVIHMDGWGPPRLKRDSYESYIYPEPVQFTGFKLFYKNDTRQGHPLMKPEDVLALFPKPVYIQYQ